MGMSSQQKGPHKRKTPKFFHCDDVPRQTISFAAPEPVSLMTISLSTSHIHRNAEKRREHVRNRERY
jgi:hypothetical protein